MEKKKKTPKPKEIKPEELGDDILIVRYPPGNAELAEEMLAFAEEVQATTGKKVFSIPEGFDLTHVSRESIQTPYYTLGPNSDFPLRERYEHEETYQLVEVFNSLAPSRSINGMPVKPAPDNGEWQAWVVEVDGKEILVHHAEEAWEL